MLKTILLVSACTALTSCATPRTSYSAYSQAQQKQGIGPNANAYMLPLSIIQVRQSDPKEGAVAYEMTLRRVEDPQWSFDVQPINKYGVATKLSIVKVSNTHLLQSVSVEIEDKRTEFVQKSFKLLGTVFAGVKSVSQLGISGVTPERFPVNVNTLSELNKKGCKREGCSVPALTIAKHGVTAKIDVAAVSPSALDVNFVAANAGDLNGVIIAPACRQATMRIVLPHDAQDSVLNFSLADPRYVELIPLPAKGTISFHDECGVSVTQEKVEITSNLDLATVSVEELVKLIQAVRKEEGDETKK